MQIAILIPCHNEETTVRFVINSFRAVRPAADIYVYDNDSTDRTAEEALAAGVTPRREPLRGKGNVVRRMFADVEADVYVLVDGDGHGYDAATMSFMLHRLVNDQLDMVVGRRRSEGAGRSGNWIGHALGNRMLTGAVALAFGRDLPICCRDIGFSRRFVKSFPALSSGFEIETELTVHALSLSLPTAEIDTPYFARPEGCSRSSIPSETASAF